MLTEDGQAQLALMVDTFTRSHEKPGDRHFTAAELEEIRNLAAQPFRPAAESDVSDFFARNDPES